MNRGLIIFVKNPALGRVKTRLASVIGDEMALDIYNKLLAHTRVLAAQAKALRFVFYDQYIDAKDDWDARLFEKHVQLGADLGERMSNAFTLVLSDVKMAVIIGSDCLDLTPHIIEDAFNALERHDAVIGPALDGGYYLLGLKRHHPRLFAGKRWSTSSVYGDTIADLTALGWSHAVLPALSDIDTIDDLRKSSLREVLPSE